MQAVVRRMRPRTRSIHRASKFCLIHVTPQTESNWAIINFRPYIANYRNINSKTVNQSQKLLYDFFTFKEKYFTKKSIHKIVSHWKLKPIVMLWNDNISVEEFCVLSFIFNENHMNLLGYLLN